MITTLERVAVECGELVLSLRGKAMDAEDKNEQLGAHFSTRADRLSQEHGLKILQQEQPDEFVIAEEAENARNIPANCSVFDPLDGTGIFYGGLDDFGVTLCSFRDFLPTYAATYFPTKKILVSAVRHSGCYIGGFKKGLRVGSIGWHGKLDKTLLATDIGSWALRHETFDLVLRPLATRFNILSTMAAVEAGRRVLMGQVGAYYNFGIAKVWDAAAMSLAVEEAGGIVCDPQGKPLRWGNLDCDWIIAGNQQLADIVVEHARHWPGRK